MTPSYGEGHPQNEADPHVEAQFRKRPFSVKRLQKRERCD
jgi:hypothetical protein